MLDLRDGFEVGFEVWAHLIVNVQQVGVDLMDCSCLVVIGQCR
jgi:hypothetical protein